MKIQTIILTLGAALLGHSGQAATVIGDDAQIGVSAVLTANKNSSILGGYNNENAGLMSMLGGGAGNYISLDAGYGSIVGGYENWLSADMGTIGGDG